MQPLELHPDRFFDADPSVRSIARKLYESTKDLPLVCPHGHVPAELLDRNDPFPEPTSLIITPDHYIFRMLHARGIRLDQLGIPTRGGTVEESDPRVIWQTFADHYYLFRGTPTRAWLDFVFYDVLGIRVRLDSGSAMYVYDGIQERLQEPEFRPRALYDSFNIEVLTTTDAASDSLSHHQSIRDSDWSGRVVPCFRPDAAFKIASPVWHEELQRLATVSDTDISNYQTFLDVLRKRRQVFKALGSTSSDHGVESPATHRLSAQEAGQVFERALGGNATTADQAIFEAHMLMEMAEMSLDDWLVMQIHAGSYRNHNQNLFDRFGADAGADIPLATEFTRSLQALLNAYGSDPRFGLVVFTLDESTYARELAPLAGHYPAMRLGPAWWFFDSIAGMTRYRELVTETAGFYNTAGFNDDTRAFLSIPSRHDLSRRVDANYLAGLVAQHQIDLGEAMEIARALTYDLVKETYRMI